MNEDPQQTLFGAPARELDMIHFSLIRLERGRTIVSLATRAKGKRQMVTMSVTIEDDQSVSTVLGMVARLMHQHWLHPKAHRASMLSISKKLGADGYAVSLY